MEHTKNKPFKQKLLFIKDVEQIIGRNRLTLRRWWSAGKFPTPTKLNGTVLVWQTDVIEQWINLHTESK
ncbi:TPA: AlpA family phage regulatory protein [Legionella pneumophila]|uniref:Prophage regulatory protein-like n=2 Tax=Legionella pneumophila TaxID=446 RepID=Q5ZSF4_LEGPH|nr:AlpA family phage regulatory protein [Legionella pneumophila]WBV63545.1 AlpA family phage regulatory protein [Legionella pneumophila 130b]AAU28623.1 prophage regulatory protein-like [Legionella pneumophila subsp. pneumophila str. Philadelphia 1]AEW52800.1 prophage regulatory protein-like protein [Legionella pneumophila subsp. pneumophila ATCC 43290]AGH52569.1 hypothetical protein LPE509_00478 [Legionella pneumophila subsp. pneumophila LPE509]AGN15488.1 putative prophage regulatory protein [